MAKKRIKDLGVTATAADLKAGNYLVLDGAEGTKKLDAENVARESVVGEYDREGTISNFNWYLIKSNFKVGETIHINLVRSPIGYAVNVVATIDGSQVVIKQSSDNMDFDYVVPEGLSYIGLWASQSTTYKMTISSGIAGELKNLGSEIDALKDGITLNSEYSLFSNLLMGYEDPDIFIGSHCAELKNYLGTKGAVVKSVKENGLQFTRVHLPAGTNIDGYYKQITLYEMVTNCDENGIAECYVAAKVKNTTLPADDFSLRVLTNNGWSTPNLKFRNTTDNFKFFSSHVTKTGNPGDVVKFQLKMFLSSASAYTTAGDVNYDFFNVAMSTRPIRTDGCYERFSKDSDGKVLLSLGDSITTESYYIKYLRSKLGVVNYRNLAVVSATLCDNTETRYDGDPKSSVWSNNVLGNQVQKIIDNFADYSTNPPDIILIAIGTNDNTPAVSENDYDDVESYFTTDGGTNYVDCTEPTFDDSDTYKLSRRKFAGALRYVVTKLQSLFPKATIFVSTPIQASISTRKVRDLRIKQQLLCKIAERLGVVVIRTGEECGISQEFEYNGNFWDSSWATTSAPHNGRDLIDGLHPNTNGSKKMANYIGNRIQNFYSEI